ncbi:MAG: colicin V production protein [Draconibacterium sp.]|nr:MAG: colicin V production protein [Draconibacterium sp.]
MNYIDIVLALLLFFAAISGFKNGFIAEIASLAALILGVWGAIKFSYVTTDFLTNTLNFKSQHIEIISFIATLIVIVIVVHLIGSVANKLINVIMMGFLNKLAGLVFGVLKSALILSVVLVVLDHFDNKMHFIPEQAKTESKMYAPLRDFAPTLLPFIDFFDKKELVPDTEGQVV